MLASSPCDMAIPEVSERYVPSPMPSTCIAKRKLSADEVHIANNNVLLKMCRVLGDVATISCFVGRASVVRGDIAKITLGQGVFIEDSVIIRPPLRITDKVAAEAIAVTIGNYVFVGYRTVCEAMSIGNFVIVESDCIVGERCVIGHGCWLKAGTVVPSGQSLIPFGVYQGNPAALVGRAQEDVHPTLTREFISQHFQSLQ